MSSDGTEPSAVVFYGPTGKLIEEHIVIERLLKLKSDLATAKLSCLNTSVSPLRLDDISPSRSVVRVRMSSGWFDYRFPAAPEFFVGRSIQLVELQNFISDVIEGRTSTRGFLVSGKSGIGKSSFALKARHLLQNEKIVFLPIDSRLCDDISFLYDAVNELLFELRQVPELIGKLDSVRVYGLDSLINTLVDINKVIAQEGYLSVLFFDQFEKVFEYPEVASTIRALFLRVTEKQLFVLFGFAWKSDLWSLAEGFPHHERDDIVREALQIRTLTQFGQEETVEIIKQLEIQWGSKLSIVLTRRLGDFSRGLPWLLKKVCAHLLEQKSQGVTESELIETNLKLQDLFEADLAGLDDEERSLLRTIAPLLPATLRRISESFEISNIDQSLHRFIDKRILVKISEDIGDSLANVKYDAYSDIFREFIITGNVPIEDAFYFFTYPQGAFRFFDKVRERGKLSIEEELAETGKQMASIYNLSRDLRSLSLVNLRNRVFTIADDVANLEQEEIVSFLQIQLKRNRVVSLILSELNENGSMTRSHEAELLQELFPSVQAVEKTWDYYSKTTAQWLHYARLAFYNKKDDSLQKVDDEAVFEAALARGRTLITGYRFPMCFRNSIKECLERIDSLGEEVTIPQLMDEFGLSHQSIEKVLSDCLNLQFAEYDEHTKKYSLTPLGAEFARSSEEIRRKLFRQQCLNVPVFNRFIYFIEIAGDKGINSKEAAKDLIQEMSLDLAELTIEKLGAMLANWAEYAGVIDKRGRLCFAKGYLPEQFNMFDMAFL
jgi:predicted transcriptional regulator